jgi:hypothetical protein
MDFLKTGFSLIAQSEDEVDITLIKSIILNFMENSLKNAALYAKHAKRNCVTGKDIKISLMFEYFVYKMRKNQEENIEKWKEIIENESDSEEDDSELEDTDDIFNYSLCECGFCKKLNKIEKDFLNHQPDLIEDSILYKHLKSFLFENLSD